MHDWRDSTTAILSPVAPDRWTILIGPTTLIGAGLATRVRADDLSTEMILNGPDAPVSGNSSVLTSDKLFNDLGMVNRTVRVAYDAVYTKHATRALISGDLSRQKYFQRAFVDRSARSIDSADKFPPFSIGQAENIALFNGRI